MSIDSPDTRSNPRAWPPLPYDAWKDTCTTLHRWIQIVGKVRRTQSPWVNHSWSVPLYVTGRGLTTSPVPHGRRLFQIDFDFVEHRLRIETGDASTRSIALAPRSVADFHGELFAQLAALGLDVKIHEKPNEVADAIPFAQDHVHASYDAEYANRFWRALAQADRVFKQFRSRFVGKSSPVHFFWGSFDLAVTRFSGRPAPVFSGSVPNCPDWVMREAYSHEVSSCGFWPGNDAYPHPAFYAYAYPEPAGFGASRVGPEGAAYHPDLREFILPYEIVRQAPSPDAALLQFLQESYEAAAVLAGWDRCSLEDRRLFPAA